jgi:arylsulfatase A-like enzyme
MPSQFARQRARQRAFWASGLWIAALLVACPQASEPDVGSELRSDLESGNGDSQLEKRRPPNLILLSIDTLRAGRLGTYGYERETSPHIDALAARGVRFERAISETSWTLPAHMTLVTGRHPTSHGVTGPADALPDEFATLAELLQQRGYRTFALTGGGFVHGRFGFARGFEAYSDERNEFAHVLSAAKERIASFDPEQSWFLFLHTYAVHCPYDPPEHFAAMFRTRPPGDRVAPELCGGNDFAPLSLDPGQLRFVSDQYDAGVRAADESLGAFLEFLDSRGLFENTVFVLVSDHGEELGEHGRIGHEQTLHLESLHVPLIVVAPGVEPGVVSAGVGLVDVLPTLLDLLGVDAPASVQGRSLVPLLEGAADDAFQRPLFSELDFRARIRSVLDDDSHLIRDRLDKRAGRSRRYDLSSDPTEQSPRTDAGPETSALEAVLSRHLGTLERPTHVPPAGPPPDEIEDLRALGYVE